MFEYDFPQLLKESIKAASDLHLSLKAVPFLVHFSSNRLSLEMFFHSLRKYLKGKAQSTLFILDLSYVFSVLVQKLSAYNFFQALAIVAFLFVTCSIASSAKLNYFLLPPSVIVIFP